MPGISLPNQEYWINLGVNVIFFWFIGMVILVGLGYFLSQWILDRFSSPELKPSPRGLTDIFFRDLYRLVVVLACVYFYLSIPVLFIIQIGAAFIVLAFWLEVVNSSPILTGAGVILPLIFSLLLFYSAFGTVISTLIGVIFPMRRKLFGRPLTREEAPKMWAVVEEVAKSTRTRVINRIYLRPETIFGVEERGFLPLKLIGLGRRCLFVGLGVLPGMDQAQFKAILAHEYGHFAHRDMVGGGLALQVHDSVRDVAINLKQAGMATWTNPAWLFLVGYDFLFNLTTLGASRTQEILADRRSALTYGADAFISGLNHVVRQQIRFEIHLRNEAKQSLKEKRPMRNLYQLPPLEPQWEKEVSIRLMRADERGTDAFDTHPSLSDRIQMVQGLNPPVLPEGSNEPVWELFPAEQIQEEMTNYMQRRVVMVLQDEL